MKNYYTSKIFFLLLFFYSGKGTHAYNSNILHTTLKSSTALRDLFLNDAILIKNAATEWHLTNQASHSWEFKHIKTSQSAYLMLSPISLSDVTGGSQVLLKEYGILGLEILSSKWVTVSHTKSRLLKLELKQSSSQSSIYQYLFDTNLIKEKGLHALTCPLSLEQPCLELASSITPRSPNKITR